MKIPTLDLRAEYLYMKPDIDTAITRCLEHQQWILGPEVKEFEDKVAEYIGAKHCIGTSSGTDALVLALRALAIKTKGEEYFDRNDLIITTPFTFTATGDAILRAGATPLFVDIDPLTYNLDPALIREAIVRSKESGVKSLKDGGHDSLLFTPHSLQVVGILPVHLYGQPCQMDEIMSIAQEYGLFVVEDCAQAFGAFLRGKRLGAIGDAGAFSFFPSKNLGGFGDAGAITTDDNELAGLIRMLIKHGGKDKYNVDHIGYNARLDTLQAAVLLTKLKYVDEFNTRRQHIAQLYTEALRDVPNIVLPVRSEESGVKGLETVTPHSLPFTPDCCECPPLTPYSSLLTHMEHVYHQFTLRILNGKRDALQLYLKSSGIDSMVYYPVPLHKMKVFEGRCMVHGELSEAGKAVKEVLSLPIEPLQNEDVTVDVARCIERFFS